MEENLRTTVSKNKEGYGYKYTDLAQIHDYLEKIGARYYQYVDRIEGDDYIMTVPIIEGKELPPRRGVRIVDAVLSGIKNPAQEQGSATTYARRYSLLMAFGLATDDDDAASLTETIEVTKEEALEYELTFGKYKGKKLKDVSNTYVYWLLENSKDIKIKKCCEAIVGEPLSEEEQEKMLDLMTELSDLLNQTNTNREKLYEHYKVKSNANMTKEQLEDAIKKLKSKLGE